MPKRDPLIVYHQGTAVPLDTPTALAESLASQRLPAIRRWNRLEGRPRSKDFDQAVRAEVRDPLWNLSKQWQVGEFNGEGRGSAMFGAITARRQKRSWPASRSSCTTKRNETCQPSPSSACNSAYHQARLFARGAPALGRFKTAHHLV